MAGSTCCKNGVEVWDTSKTPSRFGLASRSFNTAQIPSIANQTAKVETHGQAECPNEIHVWGQLEGSDKPRGLLTH